MTDQVTTGEISRGLGRVEKAVDVMSGRLDSLDQHYVPKDVWTAERDAIRQEIADSRHHTEAEVRLVTQEIRALTNRVDEATQGLSDRVADFRKSTQRMIGWGIAVFSALAGTFGSVVIVLHH